MQTWMQWLILPLQTKKKKKRKRTNSKYFKGRDCLVLALSIYIALAVCRPPSACPKCSNMTYPHFTDGRTEAQRGQVTCPRPRSQRVEAEQESEPSCSWVTLCLLKTNRKKGLCNPENHQPPNLPYSEEEIHSGEELEQHYQGEQGGKREGHKPGRCHSRHIQAGAGGKKGETVKPAATRFKLARNAGLSFAWSHPRPSTELGTSRCSPRGSAPAEGGFGDHAAKPRSLARLRLPASRLSVGIKHHTVRNHITTRH